MKTKVDKSLFKKAVNNKIILYIVAFIALLDVLGYLMRQEFSAILLFYLVATITFYYTKNMTIVLGSALIITTLTHVLKYSVNVREGFKEGKTSETSKTSKTSKTSDTSNTSIPSNPSDNKQIEEEMIKLQAEIDSLQNNEPTKNKTTKKSGYQNQIKLSPGLYNIPNKDQLAKQLGEADKMESAYNDLEKVIGENGIKSMSSNTKELVKQQKELLNGLKEITPALNEAMGAIGKIDLGNLSSMFKKVNMKSDSD